MLRARLLGVQLLAFVVALGAFAVTATACEGGGSGGKELTTLSTTLSGEGKEGETLTVAEGTKVKDKATLTGKNASKATGKVKYKIYSEKECKTLVKEAGEVTVSGESVPASSEEELEAGKAYYWQAHYGGDEKNDESTSPCTEVLKVQAKTSLSTKLSGGGEEGEEITVNEGTKVKDKATLTGTNSSSAEGKVLYKIFSDKECKTLVKEAGEESVSGGAVTASSEEELEGGKTYYWQATYKGDSLHKESTSSCGSEVLKVKAKTTLATKLSGGGEEGEEITINEGTKAKDKATVEGTNSSSAEGKVLYKVYSDSKCEHLVTEAGEKSVSSGAGTASNEEELEGAEVYYWQATYKGDSLHQESKSSCGKEVLTVKAKTTLSTTLSGEGKEAEELTVLEGSKIKDRATLSGTHSSTAGGKVTYRIYSDSECKDLVATVGEETVTSGSVPASNEEELEAGATYYWQATFSGDSLHQESESTCGKEIVKVNPAWIVSVGDSFISGEGGRWAGNTDLLSPSAIDALGTTAYYDNAGHTEERIPGCHRSQSAEIYIGGTTKSENLACEAARTYTFLEASNEHFKPGLDFENKKFGQGLTTGGNCPLTACEGQALMLQHFAEAHSVKMVAISIGGNNFGFGPIVEACVKDYLLSSIFADYYCSTEATVTERVNAAAVKARTTEIEEGITHVAEAMNKAGYNNGQYTILVQNYPQLIPTGENFRYPQSLAEGATVPYERQSVGGCGFWNADANWANATALPAINEAVEDAAIGTGLGNIKKMKIEKAFQPNLLCGLGIGLLEERGLASWTEAAAVNETEWVNQVRLGALLFGPYESQESIHPNYWGQLALRNCMRQAYNRGNPKSGECEVEAAGLTGGGEPKMRLR